VLFRRPLPGLPTDRRWRPPSLCAVCHGWDAQRVCSDCLRRFARAVDRCRRCAIEVPAGVDECGACLKRPPAFASTLAALDYAYPWDGLVSRLKFNAALDLAPVLAGHMVAAVRTSAQPLPDLVLPVPLSAQRLRERGFNQAFELARRIAAGLGCRSDARLLLRVRDSAHQTALRHDQRAANVHGVFAVEPLRRDALRGLDLALVDDVMTTGATADEAARVLLQAGAASVAVWVAARTPAPSDR
jgi:ComF family protein